MFEYIGIIISIVAVLYVLFLSIKAAYVATGFTLVNLLDLVDCYRGVGYHDVNVKWWRTKRVLLPIFFLPVCWLCDFFISIKENFTLVKTSSYQAGRWKFDCTRLSKFTAEQMEHNRRIDEGFYNE